MYRNHSLVRNRADLNRAYGEWLDTFKWDFFATLTFALAPSSRTSLHHFHRFTRYLGRMAPGGVGYFVGSETGGQHGREHLHALLYFPPDPNYDLIHPEREQGLHILKSYAWRWWFDHYGRAAISGVNDKTKASHYVTKYCTKTLAEWDIGGKYEYQRVDSEHREGVD